MTDRVTSTGDNVAAHSRWRRVFLNRWLLIGVAAVVSYALLGFFLAPWLLKRYVSRYAAESLNRKAAITEIRINPFLFTIEGKDFVFQEMDGRPIVSFGRLFVDFELSSLFRWAWTFADIRIEHPSLYVEIRQDGSLNFAELADSFPRSGKPPPADPRPPRLLLQRTEILNGVLTFSDQSNPTPATETISPINLQFDEISTLPERKGPYAVKANLPGGGAVGWQGEISLHPIFSSGELSVTGFKLATGWKFVQDRFDIAEPEGELDFSTRYRFGYQQRTPQLLLQDAKFEVRNIGFTQKREKKPLLALDAIEADGMRFDLQARELEIPNIVVRNGKVSAAMDEKGVFDWQELVIPRTSSEAPARRPESSTTANQPWHLMAESVRVVGVGLAFTDDSRGHPLALTVDGVGLSLKLTAEFGAGPATAIVDDRKTELVGIRLSEERDGHPLLSLDSFMLKDGRIDIGNRAITIAQMEAAGGSTSVVHGKKGQIRPLSLFAPSDNGANERGPVETAEKKPTDDKPWSFRLDAFALKGFQVGLQDQSFTPGILYDLKDIQVSLKNITNDRKTPIACDASFKVAQGGRAAISGRVSPTGDHATGRVTLTDFSIKPLQPAVDRYTLLTLESGEVSASMELNYRAQSSGPQVNAAGSVDLNALRLIEATTGERFLQWRRMSANGLRFGLSPQGLRIDEVSILEPDVKVVIFKDHSLNLAKVVKHPDTAVPETGAPPAGAQAPASEGNPMPFPVTIDRVHVEKGSVDYADLSLILPFATRVTDFSGGVARISSDPASRASVKFGGRVDKYGFAKAEGSLSPFTPKAFTQISVLFRNVEMKPLTPYTATFAGRKIASGKLNLDLNYNVRNSELVGENKVVLEKFTLGKRVEAPDAVNLPLDLAVALLTDADGKIDIAVPVHGNVDHPEFSYGRVIWQAFVKLITRVATAPFRALAGIFGDDSGQMDAIVFNPGSARLLPPEQEKLKAVAEALDKRPQLKLVVEGRFDTKKDSEALRTARARRALAEQTGMTLAPESEPGPIAFDSAKTQHALEKLLEMRSGETAVADFEKKYEETTGKKAKRANFAMSIVGMASSDTAFYQAMFNALIGLEPLSDNDLEDLAKQRAEAIENELKTTAGLDDRRVTLGSPGPSGTSSEEAVRTTLKLDVIKPSA
jgi:hypothetical protein